MTLTHCPKNNLNLFIKTEPHTVRADDTVCVWLMGRIYCTVRYSTELYCMCTNVRDVPLHPLQPY